MSPYSTPHIHSNTSNRSTVDASPCPPLPTLHLKHVVLYARVLDSYTTLAPSFTLTLKSVLVASMPYFLHASYFAQPIYQNLAVTPPLTLISDLAFFPPSQPQQQTIQPLKRPISLNSRRIIYMYITQAISKDAQEIDWSRLLHFHFHLHYLEGKSSRADVIKIH